MQGLNTKGLHLIIECKWDIGPVIKLCKLIWKIAQVMNMKIGHKQSDFFPTCQIWFSLTMRLFDEFLDILESLECVLQSIFVMKVEILSVSMWKVSIKLVKNLAYNRAKFF